MDIKKIDSVTFSVRDLARSTDFYATVLGLPELWRTDDPKAVGFGVGDNSATINLFEESPAPRARLVVQVEDVKAARADLERKGVRFEGPTQTVEDIGLAAPFADPDGNFLLLLDYSIEHAREAAR